MIMFHYPIDGTYYLRARDKIAPRHLLDGRLGQDVKCDQSEVALIVVLLRSFI